MTVQQGRVVLGGQGYTAVTQTLANDEDETSRLLVLDARCRTAWSATADGVLSHFDVRALGHAAVLQFVTLQVYGDGTGYVHRLLVARAGRIVPLVPPIRHFGKDGFYLGPLQPAGEGVVTWSADPANGSEADAHPFVVSTWRWAGGRLRGPTRYETAQPYAAPDDAPSRPDVVAAAMGLPYRDQTGSIQNRFRDFDRVETQMEALVMRHQAAHE